MKKYFNEKHEAIIQTTPVYAEKTDGKKEGDLIKMKNHVQLVKWYQPKYDQFGNHIGIEQVFMTREQLFDLYEQSVKIEAEVYEGEYSSFPF